MIKYQIFLDSVIKIGEISVPSDAPLGGNDKMEIKCLYGRLHFAHYSRVSVSEIVD